MMVLPFASGVPNANENVCYSIATADQKVTQLVAPGTHFIMKCSFWNMMSLEFK